MRFECCRFISYFSRLFDAVTFTLSKTYVTKAPEGNEAECDIYIDHVWHFDSLIWTCMRSDFQSSVCLYLSLNLVVP